ncbi:MAG: hypothetical protein KGH62_02065 [Candidatus Micrarchaeota archaeon]|nr:hypothetical protein [Candidatus Micrarchaeota archaeon]
MTRGKSTANDEVTGYSTTKKVEDIFLEMGGNDKGKPSLYIRIVKDSDEVVDIRGWKALHESEFSTYRLDKDDDGMGFTLKVRLRRR